MKATLFLADATVSDKTDTIRNQLIAIARSQIGVREATGKNDGLKVEEYLKLAKLPKGNPYCAAFVSWVYHKAGYAQPRTPWSPALFPLARQTLMPKPADVLGIYSAKLKRIAHCGLVERKQNNWIISIEGNTNGNGSREGDGVYRKWRHVKTIAKFADWIN
ncbi:MAG: peptidoglycan-binding protein [Bacteroidia bacterium]